MTNKECYNNHIDWLFQLGLYETRFIIYDVATPELFEACEEIFEYYRQKEAKDV